jgi:hypothetical protein
MKSFQLLTFLFLITQLLRGQEIFENKIASNCTLTVVKNDSLQKIDIANNSNIVKSLRTDETSYFEDPVFFKFDNSTFLRIQEVVYGTGYSNVEHIYHITQDCRLDSVQFEEAYKQYARTLDKGEAILKGEYRTFKDNEITFSFGIWSKEDPNCCPSKGYMKGKYKLTRTNKEGRYQITVSEQRWMPDF